MDSKIPTLHMIKKTMEIQKNRSKNIFQSEANINSQQNFDSRSTKSLSNFEKPFIKDLLDIQKNEYSNAISRIEKMKNQSFSKQNSAKTNSQENAEILLLKENLLKITDEIQKAKQEHEQKMKKIKILQEKSLQISSLKAKIPSLNQSSSKPNEIFDSKIELLKGQYLEEELALEVFL